MDKREVRKVGWIIGIIGMVTVFAVVVYMGTSGLLGEISAAWHRGGPLLIIYNVIDGNNIVAIGAFMIMELSLVAILIGIVMYNTAGRDPRD
jgi:hypothetical protein